MSILSKKSATILIVVICVITVYGIKYSQGNPPLEESKDLFARMKGDINAPIKITEFADFQCPACAYASKYIKEFMKIHPGKLRVEMKYYPLMAHKHAFLSATYAECTARQGKFWKFHDIVF